MHQILPLAWLKFRCSCSSTALRVFFPCRIIISSWLASLAYVQSYISSLIRCHTIYQSSALRCMALHTIQVWIKPLWWTLIYYFQIRQNAYNVCAAALECTFGHFSNGRTCLLRPGILTIISAMFCSNINVIYVVCLQDLQKILELACISFHARGRLNSIIVWTWWLMIYEHSGFK